MLAAVEEFACVWPNTGEDDLMDEGSQEGVWTESEEEEAVEMGGVVEGDGVIDEGSGDAIEGSIDEEDGETGDGTEVGRGGEGVGENGLEEFFGKDREMRHVRVECEDGI